MRTAGEGLIPWNQFFMQEEPGWAGLALHMNHTLGVVTVSRSEVRLPWGCSLEKSYSVPVLPLGRCFLIFVLLMELAEKMLWCTTRWQFITWDAAVNSLGMLSLGFGISRGSVIYRHQYGDSRDRQFKRGWKHRSGSLLCVGMKKCKFQLILVSGFNKNWCAVW